MTAARPRPGTRANLWRQVNAEHTPLSIAGRYTTLARLRASRSDPLPAASAREDIVRMATALRAVLSLHGPDQQHRCRACAVGPFLVEWPCATRRALDDGLRLAEPPPADHTDTAEPEPDQHEGHEGFALAVLAIHDILPAAGGHPAVCRTCLVPPSDCPIWTLADGFLGIACAGPLTTPAPVPAGPAAGTR